MPSLPRVRKEGDGINIRATAGEKTSNGADAHCRACWVHQPKAASICAGGSDGKRVSMGNGGKRAPSVDWSHPSLRRGVGGKSSDEGHASKRRSIDCTRASSSLEHGAKAVDIRKARPSLSIEREKLLPGQMNQTRPRERGNAASPPRAPQAATHLGDSRDESVAPPPREGPPSPARLQEIQKTMQVKLLDLMQRQVAQMG